MVRPPSTGIGIHGADHTFDESRMGLVCRKNGLINQVAYLEECSRRGTSLENVLGDGAYPERLRVG
jgi:hypothetical protein